MRRLTIGALAFSLTGVLAAAQACGGKSSNAPMGSPDSGKSDAPATVDSGMVADTGMMPSDGGPADAADAGPDCGTMPPTGKQVVASTDPIVVFTLTTDGPNAYHAIYENLMTQELYAVPLSGGMPSDIGKMTSQGSTVWAHGSALLWLPTASDPQYSVAPLKVWTPSGGTVSISPSAFALDAYDYVYDVSDDGKYIAYYATTSGARTGTLTVSTIDGKTQTPIVMNVDMQNGNCFPPMLQFSGNTLIAQYCPEMDDASTETTTVATFSEPSFTPVVLGTAFLPPQVPISVDPSGNNALIVAGSGTGLSLYPLDGGSPLTVDPTGVTGTFTASGDVLYTTSSTGFSRYTTKTATITSLVPSGLNYPLYQSPDGNWMQLASQSSSTTGLLDLYIASTTKPGPAIPIVTTTTTGPLAFTADSKYSMFESNVPMDFGTKPVTLNFTKTSGGTPVKFGQAAFAPAPTAGSKVVFPGPETPSSGQSDILLVDLSTTSGPTTLVSQADPNLFLLSPTELVYTWYCDASPHAGLWTLTPP